MTCDPEENDDILKRMERMAAEEQSEPPVLWYLSFAAPERWLGAAIVEARGFTSAILKTHALGINPGGEAWGMAVPVELTATVGPERRDRLLNIAECRECFGELTRMT